jgi:uncharacterized Zn finger protein
MGWGYGYGYGGFAPYVSVVQRRATAAREMAKLAKKGQVISPVKLEGRKIAASFWGKGWCDHLESYSDFSNRLPRGRTYVRNGSVVDLQIRPGKISARVMGSELYEIQIAIEPLKKARWEALKKQCAGKIKSVLELLKGGVSAGVMEVMSNREQGMFPAPKEIKMECSCPDWAGLCKHLAAVLYGVGSRLDSQPELLFTLRQVDPAELIAQATKALGRTPEASGEKLGGAELSEVFGIDVIDDAEPEAAANTVTPPPSSPVKVVRRVVRKAAALRGKTKTPAGKRRTRVLSRFSANIVVP